MKKRIVGLFLMTMVSYSGISQKMYGGIGLGYGFKLAPMWIGDDITPNSRTAVNKSFGAGFSPGLLFGYSMNDNLALQLDFNYLLGSKIEVTDISGFSESNELTSRMLRIAPSFKISFGEKLKPYSRFGVIFGFAGKVTDDAQFYNGLTPYHVVTEYSGGLSFGFTSALGANYAFSENLSLFAELNANAQSWSPKRSEITEYVVNGADVLGLMTVNEKETEYVDSYDPNTSVGSGSPDPETKFYFPFSSWGIILGVAVSF